ncbi:hypothetical protein [Agrobacterium rosae]|uniref:Uncharacterized protein n=1 Tax=Agrobacterium rosae TaxID=1972867 RepID=A0A1R3TIQ0_9HYPH|nr:hypothetical protein [Agrobacterium rosae]SCX19373.1 hypothetical protein DSM25559_1836 [Agrobacterium rosae]
MEEDLETPHEAKLAPTPTDYEIELKEMLVTRSCGRFLSMSEGNRRMEMMIEAKKELYGLTRLAPRKD